MTITTVQDLDSLATAAEAESTRRALHHLAIELVQRDDQVTGLRASVVELRKQLDLMRAHNQAQSEQLTRMQAELELKRRVYDEVHTKWCAESAEADALRLKLEAHMARRKKK